MSTPVATVVIPTKNRPDDLRRALQSCRNQSVPLEVIVVDDASADLTSAMVRQDFPEVRLIRHEVSGGPTVCRNEAADCATTEFMFSLDDDSAFMMPNVVETTLADFETPRVGVVAIPFRNVLQGDEMLQRAPDRHAAYAIGPFVAASCAFRRSAFLQAGGYCAAFDYLCEESDLAVRLLNLGYYVRLGIAEHIDHWESPRRSFDRMDYFGARNTLRLVWQNTPMPDLMLQLPGTFAKVAAFSLKIGRWRHRYRGIAAAGREILTGKCRRSPVSARCWRTFRRLSKSPPLTAAEVHRRMNWTDDSVAAMAAGPSAPA